jgi:hypothetical protein
MCIFLFNPPAPACVPKTRCGACHCMPRFWQLEAAAFSYLDPQGETVSVSPFQAIMEYGELGFSFIGGAFPFQPSGDCFWGLSLKNTREAKSHLMYQPWYLWFDLAAAAWKLIISAHVGVTIEYGLTAFANQPVSEQSVPANRQPGRFECLSPNRFYLFPDQGDYPLSADLTPYYP